MSEYDVWLRHPFTTALIKDLENQKTFAMTALFAACRTSTDPSVRAHQEKVDRLQHVLESLNRSGEDEPADDL